MRAKYIFRIDDVVPGMNWSNFEKIESIFDKYGVKPIIGVVPDNKDFTIGNNDYTQEFWDKINRLVKKGWTVAQHGYNHEFVTKQSGIIGLNNFSEFAGVSYHEQERKILDGMRILKRYIKNYDIKWFMAPGHSFDKNTCEILKIYNFEYITDGLAIYPFTKYGLKWLPQQIWKPMKKKFGIWTICLHINKYDDEFIKKIDSFCCKNKKNFISDFSELNYTNTFLKRITTVTFKMKFWLIHYLYNLFNIMFKIVRFIITKNKELKGWGGPLMFIKGCFILIRNYILCKIYKFDNRHILPGEFMPYTRYIYKTINDLTNNGKVVEIGCGLGNILNHLKNKDIEGYDISQEVINAASFINKNNNYFVGSFDTVKNKNIEILIAVNFIHCISPEELKIYLDKITKNNKVKYLVLDEIVNNPSYKYNHQLDVIIPKNYEKVKTSPEFVGGRRILFYKNNEQGKMF